MYCDGQSCRHAFGPTNIVAWFRLSCVLPAIHWHEYYLLSNLVMDQVSEASKDDDSKTYMLICGGAG